MRDAVLLHRVSRVSLVITLGVFALNSSLTTTPLRATSPCLACCIGMRGMCLHSSFGHRYAPGMELFGLGVPQHSAPLSSHDEL